MVRTLIRVLGVLTAIIGVAMIAGGAWLAAQLGPNGEATFTQAVEPGQVVVFTPSVLNRLDTDVVVTATATKGSQVWGGLANPSDAVAVLGDGAYQEVTGVAVRGWKLESTARGTTELGDTGSADLWRAQQSAHDTLELPVSQAQAPETAVVVALDGDLTSVGLTVADKRWFVIAVVTAIVGLFVIIAGLIMAWPRRQAPGGKSPRPGPRSKTTGAAARARERASNATRRSDT